MLNIWDYPTLLYYIPIDEYELSWETLFMVIPSIVKHASLLLTEEAGDWLRKGRAILWPMWNSSTHKNLACTCQHAQTHRRTPLTVFTLKYTVKKISLLCVYLTYDMNYRLRVFAFHRLIWYPSDYSCPLQSGNQAVRGEPAETFTIAR